MGNNTGTRSPLPGGDEVRAVLDAIKLDEVKRLKLGPLETKERMRSVQVRTTTLARERQKRVRCWWVKDELVIVCYVVAGATHLT